MRAPIFYRIAASVAILAVAVPMTAYILTSEEEGAGVVSYANRFANDLLGGAGEESHPVTRDLNAVLRNAAPPSPLDGKIAKEGERRNFQSGPSDIAGQPAPQRNAATLPHHVRKQEFAAAPRQDQRAQAGEPQPGEAGGRTTSNAPSSRLAAVPSASKREAGQEPPKGAVQTSLDEQYAEPEAEEHRNQFDATPSNPVKQVAAEPVSAFSIDVDTASYAFVRRALNAGQLPPKDAVRVEEMINYFPYDYPRSEMAEAPFQPTVTVVPSPWKPSNKLVHIAIKGYDFPATERPHVNLVFLIDVSGSMQPQDRLPLLKNAFRMLVEELKPEDTVGIVTYASGSGVALEPTRVAQKDKILAAIDALGAGGSTAGAQGIADAYRLAEAHFEKARINRIILATDGDFNVGISNRDELKGFIERKRQSGIYLSVLGVGQGNYNDALMQALAQNGNGTAAYVDTLNEARKVLVDEAFSTLFPIAYDVKVQLEFNPAQVSEYRLIGYETRALRREDFNNDKVDAGDIGSGHTVTAIYEVTPVNAPKLADDLRYRKAEPGAAAPAQGGELGFLKLRYKLPNEGLSRLISLPITSALEKPEMAAALEDVRFSVAVAAFGQLLRGTPYLQNYGFDEVLALAQTARGADPYGYRAEFLNLVRLAKSAKP